MSTGRRDLRVYWSQTSKAMNNLTPSDESKPNRTKSETATLFRSIRLGQPSLPCQCVRTVRVTSEITIVHFFS